MKPESDLEKSVKGTAWLTIASMVDYIFNIITTYVLARLLTPTDYGEVAAITILVGFADVFWQIGLGQSIIQKKNLNEKDVSTGFYINMILVSIIFCLMWVLTPFWQRTFNITNPWMLRIYSFVFIFNGLIAIPLALLQRELKFKAVTKANIISHFAYGIAVIVFAIVGLGPWALVYGVLVRYAIKTIFILAAKRINYNIKLINKSSALTLLNFSGGFTIGKIFNYIATNGDYFIINKTLGKSSLGYYQKAYSLLMYPTNLIGTNLERVFYPIFAKNQNDMTKSSRAFIGTNVVISLIAVPVSIISFYIATPLVRVFLGETWLDIVIPFKIMIIGLFFRTAYKLSISLIKAQGKVYKYAFIEAIYALMILTFAFIGHYWGVSGVAFGTTMAFMLNFVMLLIAANQYVNFGILNFCKDVFVPVVLSLPIIVLLNLSSGLIFSIPSDLAICFAVTILVFIVYIAEFFITRNIIFSSDTNHIINKVFTVIKQKIIKNDFEYR